MTGNKEEEHGCGENVCDVGKIQSYSQNSQWLRVRTGAHGRQPRLKIGHKTGSAWWRLGGGLAQ